MAAACIFCKIVKGLSILSVPLSPNKEVDSNQNINFSYSCADGIRGGREKGEIPSFKLFESDRLLAFLDIQPLSLGHALVVPKHHGAKLTDIPDESLQEILIPKPNQTEGLGIEWPAQKTDMDKLKALFNELKAKM
ncbi:MAG: hypothetical protein Q9212_000714 [Teloschistes hypoglaucus]